VRAICVLATTVAKVVVVDLVVVVAKVVAAATTVAKVAHVAMVAEEMFLPKPNTMKRTSKSLV
jgi:pseudouridine-5'-phosphate glycosidase